MYVIVDSYTRRTFVYFLKTKDETFGKFEEFKKRVENELSTRITAIRSDNGTEFVNHRFEDFLGASGIRHQRTVPYTPQSNGVAERMNRTLLDMARTMLLDAKLPIQFWAEAVATAVYLRNCAPTKGVEGSTPVQRWNGKIPSVSHIRLFGSLIYAYVPKPKREK